jgi:hypothetical protein
MYNIYEYILSTLQTFSNLDYIFTISYTLSIISLLLFIYHSYMCIVDDHFKFLFITIYGYKLTSAKVTWYILFIIPLLNLIVGAITIFIYLCHLLFCAFPDYYSDKMSNLRYKNERRRK